MITKDIDKTSNLEFSDGFGNWFIRIEKDGIKFNREKFPNSGPDDFAKAFIEILERNFKVRFTEELEPKEWELNFTIGGKENHEKND